MYHPWRELRRRPDVDVEFVDLPAGHGWWVPEQRLILIDRRLTQVQRRCTLAHELEHVDRGDTGISCGVLAGRQEARATAAAARRLITLPRLADALLWSRDQGELAEQLWVTEEVLQARLLQLTPMEHDYIDRRLWEAEGRTA